MNIYKYLNSKDVANYLKEIDYQFSPLEMAWIIWHNSSMPIKDKHNAWLELIKTTDDCEIKEERQIPHFKSLHSFLYRCIELHNRIISIYQDKTDAVYSFEVEFVDNEGKLIKDSFDAEYTTLDECIKQSNHFIETFVPSYSTLTITKKYLNKYNKFIEVIYNNNFEIIDIHDRGIVDYQKEYHPSDVFDNVWFTIPTPFKEGDILIDQTKKQGDYWKGPFVLKEIVSNTPSDWIKENGIVSDMYAYGYFVQGNADFCDEYMNNYIDLEYFKEPLVGNYRTLKLLSNYLKGDIKVDLLLKSYKSILLEEYAKSNRKELDYRKESLELAGISEKEVIESSE